MYISLDQILMLTRYTQIRQPHTNSVAKAYVYSFVIQWMFKAYTPNQAEWKSSKALLSCPGPNVSVVNPLDREVSEEETR